MRLQRLWTTCFALCLGITLAGTASAVVFTRGVACSPLGSCVLQPSPDERTLTLSGLTASGHDGAVFSLAGMTGCTCVCASGWSSADAGAQLSYQWSFANGPRQTMSLDLYSTPSSVLVTGDVVVFGGTSEQRRFVYMLDNTVVASQVVSSCSGLELRPAPGATVTLPAVSLDADQGVYVFSLRCTSTFQCSLDGGTPFDCNRVMVVSVRELNEIGDFVLDSCRLTCPIPPGSSLSSLTISSQSVMRLGQTLTASEGTIRFTGADFLGCAIGSQGSDNGLDVQQSLYRYLFGLSGSAVTNTLTAPLSLSLDSPPVDMVFPPHTGYVLNANDQPVTSSLRCTLYGSGTCSPTGEVAAIEPRSILKSFFLDTHFSPMCAVTESVIVLSQGAVVARLPLAIDGTVEVQAPSGGTPQMALASAGRPSNTGGDLKKNEKVGTTDVSR